MAASISKRGGPVISSGTSLQAFSRGWCSVGAPHMFHWPIETEPCQVGVGGWRVVVGFLVDCAPIYLFLDAPQF